MSGLMRRRDLITLLGGAAAAWPLAARAQQGDRARRIRLAHVRNNPEAKTDLSGFTQALAVLGWTDGRNLRMGLRYAGGDANRMRALTQDLVGLQPDIIVTLGATAIFWPRRAGRAFLGRPCGHHRRWKPRAVRSARSSPLPPMAITRPMTNG
jgi:hypothetical protein